MSWLPRRPSHTHRRCSSSAASSAGSRALARGAGVTGPRLTPIHTDRRCSSSAASSSGSRAWARVAALTAPALTPAMTSNQSPRSTMRWGQAPTCQLPFAPPPDSTNALRIAPRPRRLCRGELGHALVVEGGDALAGVRALEQLLLQLALERLAGCERQLGPRLHGALDEAHRAGRLVRRAELLGVQRHRLAEPVGGKDLVDESQLLPPVEREGL